MRWRRIKAVGAATVLALAVQASPVAGQADAGRMSLYSFVEPSDPASEASLAAHAGALDGLMPAWIQVTGPDDALNITPDPAGRAVIARRRGRLEVLPLVSNAGFGRWYGPDSAALLASASRRAALLDRLEPALAKLGAAGAVFDFETLPDSAQSDYRTFLAQARTRFARRGWRVGVAAPAADPAWDLQAYGRVADRVLLMAYDQHWPGGEPGPIAAALWFETVVGRASQAIPADRLIVGLAAYGYDWAQGTSAEAISAPEAQARAWRAGVAPRRDPASGNMTYIYRVGGIPHVVWYLDAEAITMQIASARANGARALAFWRLGVEDPALWPRLADVTGRS
jgi:spore germination protein YaaH